MPSRDPDYVVKIVDANGDPDMTVAVIDGIDDLSPSSGDLLFFNGTAWVNRKIADGDVPAAIARDAEVTAAVAAEATARAAAVTSEATTRATQDGLLVPKSYYDANTILVANADDTPVPLTVAASTIVGRKASGNIAALTVAEVVALLQDTLMPWRVEIDVFNSALANTNWSGNVIDTAALYNGNRQSSGAQNAEVQYAVSLAAGTWNIEVLHDKSTNRGICSIQLDQGGGFVEAGTFDCYNGSAVKNVLDSANVVVTAAGKWTLKLKMTDKNASSSSYFGDIAHITLRRTA